MATLRLRYVHSFRDRHGKLRHYFRRPGFRRVPLPGLPGSAEFMVAYQAALAGLAAPRAQPGAARHQPGSTAAAVASYFGSPAYLSLAPSTQRVQRRILEQFRARHGDKPIALLQAVHIERLIAAKADTPAAAQLLLKALRALMRHVVRQGLRPDDPARAVQGVKVRSPGIHSWTEEEIAAFERRHPVGTRARLALDLLLCTAQRRSDVVRMGRQHIRDGALHIRQQKTGAMLVIPIHPQLAASIEATPRPASPPGRGEHLNFLLTQYGKPFSSAGFGNWFREKCREAGLPPECSAHGLRKAALRRLAEAGCSSKQMQAISGHASLKELEGYVKAAEQKRMAEAAMKTVVGAFPGATTGTSSGKP